MARLMFYDAGVGEYENMGSFGAFLAASSAAFFAASKFLSRPVGFPSGPMSPGLGSKLGSGVLSRGVFSTCAMKISFEVEKPLSASPLESPR